MRRKDKEITDKAELESIINQAQVCRVAMYDINYDKFPYIVPMNFAYKNNALYFHCANQGKKIDIINNNYRVCFEMDIAHEIKTGKKPCNWTMAYKSIIGFGDARVFTDEQTKKTALDLIMLKYSKNISEPQTLPFEYSESNLENTAAIRIDILQMTGKKSGGI